MYNQSTQNFTPSIPKRMQLSLLEESNNDQIYRKYIINIYVTK